MVCSTCHRRTPLLISGQCWSCAPAPASAATAAVSAGPALAVVRARPPRYPLRKQEPFCWACGGTDALRGCIVCYSPAGGPPRGAALAVPVEVPVPAQPQPQPQARERAA